MQLELAEQKELGRAAEKEQLMLAVQLELDRAATSTCPAGAATHNAATRMSMAVDEAVQAVRWRETEHKAASIARGHALPRAMGGAVGHWPAVCHEPSLQSCKGACDPDTAGNAIVVAAP